MSPQSISHAPSPASTTNSGSDQERPPSSNFVSNLSEPQIINAQATHYSVASVPQSSQPSLLQVPNHPSLSRQPSGKSFYNWKLILEFF